MTNNQQKMPEITVDTMTELFKRSEQFHRNQAQLPIQEKVRILIELQKISLAVRPKKGVGDRRMVWQI